MYRKQQTRRSLRFWQLLSIWLVMGIGFMLYNWFLVRQDALIEPKQGTTFGVIYETTHGKNPSASYSFRYQGKEYHGIEHYSSTGYPGAQVVVFFDPDDPSKNSLTEYGRKLVVDRAMAVGCGYASCGLAAALVITFAIKSLLRSRVANGSAV
jgi:hypothetical protein